MKILLIDPSLYTPPYDGALAEALRARGHEVVIVSREPRSTDSPVASAARFEPLFYRRGERLRARRGDGGRVKLFKAAEHVLDLRRLLRFARAERPDLMHWQWPSLPLVDAAALGSLRRLCPQVVTVHDSNVFKSARGLGALRSRGWTRFLRAADRLIAHVPATRDALERMGVDPARVDIVPHGIFPRPYYATAPQVTLDPRRQHAVFFGRLSADKGVDVLAAALQQAGPAVRERLLVHVRGPAIAGDPRVAEAVRILGTLPHVHVVPAFIEEPELDALLRGADLGLFPHREVDASGALMKALAYDVGVVAADIRAFREVLGGADAARFFRCEDPADLAAVLESLAAEPARVAELKRNVAALRVGALSWAYAGQLTEAAYARTLGGAVARGAALAGGAGR